MADIPIKTSQLQLKGILSSLAIDGPQQRFQYINQFESIFDLFNDKQPISSTLIKNKCTFTNYLNSGFAIQQETGINDTAGRLAFYRKVNGVLDTNPALAINNDGTLTLPTDNNYNFWRKINNWNPPAGTRPNPELASGSDYYTTTNTLPTDGLYFSEARYAKSIARTVMMPTAKGYYLEFFDENTNTSTIPFGYYNQNNNPVFSMQGTINANSNYIIQVKDPVNAQDAATKNYCDVSKLINNTANSVINWYTAGATTPYVSNNILNDQADNFKKIQYKTSSSNFLRNWTREENLGDSNSFNPTLTLSFYNSVVNSTATPLKVIYNGSNTAGTIYTDCTLDMGGKKVVNMAAGVANTDGVNVLQLSNAVGAKQISLTGAVTGSGTGTITTTLTNINTSQINSFNSTVNGLITATTLDQLATPTKALNIGNFQLNNVAAGTANTDAVNVVQLNATVAAKSIQLTGAVTGNTVGAGGSIATTLTPINTSQISNFNAAVLAYRLDQFTAPTSSVSYNSQLITNLAAGTTNDTAVNLGQMNTAISNAVAAKTITLTGDVTGSGTSSFVTTLQPITTAKISNFNAAVIAYRLDQFTAPTAAVSFNSQRLTLVANATADTDGVNFGQVKSTITSTRLDQLAAPTAAINMNSQDFNSVNNVNATTVTTTGNVSASGNVYAGNNISCSGTLIGRRAFGQITMSANNTATTIGTAGTFVKLAGTSTLSTLSTGFSSPSTLRVTNSSGATIVAKVTMSGTLFHNNMNLSNISMAIYKNGSMQAPLMSQQATQNGQTQVVLVQAFSFAPNDYIEPWVTCSNTGAVTAVGMTTLVEAV